MLRSTSSSSSSFFKSFKRGSRSTSPPPLSHRRHEPNYSQGIFSNTRLKLPLITSLVVGILFLISTFSKPDSTINHKFQIPGLLPSRPLRQLHDQSKIGDPILASRINSTFDEFLHHCPDGNLPIHLNPSLTPKQKQRYSPLKSGKGKYMMVTNTRQIQDHLPDLLNTFITLIDYLGNDKFYISILEGPSSDCTPTILKSVLVPLLRELGVPDKNVRIETDEAKINWSNHNRIERISELRNKALSPLWSEDSNWAENVEAIVFFNDVYLHSQDILELLLQHYKNGAGITTGMDWWKKNPEYYYDIWVGRTIDTGDLFYPIEWSWWTPSSNLFHNSPRSKSHYSRLEPFQVFSSWNALAILSPKPFLPPYDIRFRRGDKSIDECAASECTLIASDFWKVGFGKVVVVPSVQLAYERDVALDIVKELSRQKRDLGWTDGVPPKKLDTSINWINKPPEKVRCHPWPEINGLSANVWEETLWVQPWLD